MGRPSKLIPERQAIITEHVAAGHTLDSACAAADVDYSNFRLWMLRGERDASGAYHDFRAAVRRAENDALMKHVSVIEEAAKKDWRAAAWWLERRHRESWGRQERVDVEVALREEAVRLAGELGMDVSEALEEAEAYLKERR